VPPCVGSAGIQTGFIATSASPGTMTLKAFLTRRNRETATHAVADQAALIERDTALILASRCVRASSRSSHRRLRQVRMYVRGQQRGLKRVRVIGSPAWPRWASGEP
jgi:hypothetical protein